MARALALQQRIEELMRATGWSVAKIAEIANVTASAVSQWLGHGKATQRISSVKVAMRLQLASGFSAMWLADGEGPKMAAELGAISDWPFELVDAARYAKLPPSARYEAQAAMLRKVEEAEASYGKPRRTPSSAPQSIDSASTKESPQRGKPGDLAA